MPASSAFEKLDPLRDESRLLETRTIDRQQVIAQIGEIDLLLATNPLDPSALYAERAALEATLPDHDAAIRLSGQRLKLVAKSFEDEADVPTLP